ncbi:MAG: hypothetical protein MSA91_09080 [Lachnobacterium sp.]|nr:hypothetical protein [Lachnobacterium sp.]MDD6632067.1 hypothetical protein [Lachnobacterium sp.]MDY2910506.1 hypothetical protein [Agathobacter sp.]
MNISGIRPSLGFYSYNSIKIDELRNQQLAVTAQEQAPMQEESTGYKDQLPVEQNFTSYDYAKSYQPDETYELKGAESDISKLDVEKTMSDLEKDKVLEQYQYFVGDQAHAIAIDMNTENKIPRSGENFVL